MATAELTCVAGYIRKWFTNLSMVTQTTKWVQRSSTSLRSKTSMTESNGHSMLTDAGDEFPSLEYQSLSTECQSCCLLDTGTAKSRICCLFLELLHHWGNIFARDGTMTSGTVCQVWLQEN